MYQPIIIITYIHPSIMLLVKLQTKIIERQVSINRKVKRGEEIEEKFENQIYKGQKKSEKTSIKSSVWKTD